MIPADAKWWSSSCGRIEIQVSPADAAKGSHQGRCDDDIEALREVPYIKAQLAALNPVVIMSELEGYGAWDEFELVDHNQNLSRLLWIACFDIKEEAMQ